MARTKMPTETGRASAPKEEMESPMRTGMMHSPQVEPTTKEVVVRESMTNRKSVQTVRANGKMEEKE